MRWLAFKRHCFASCVQYWFTTSPPPPPPAVPWSSGHHHHLLSVIPSPQRFTKPCSPAHRRTLPTPLLSCSRLMQALPVRDLSEDRVLLLYIDISINSMWVVTFNTKPANCQRPVILVRVMITPVVCTYKRVHEFSFAQNINSQGQAVITEPQTLSRRVRTEVCILYIEHLATKKRQLCCPLPIQAMPHFQLQAATTLLLGRCLIRKPVSAQPPCQLHVLWPTFSKFQPPLALAKAKVRQPAETFAGLKSTPLAGGVPRKSSLHDSGMPSFELRLLICNVEKDHPRKTVSRVVWSARTS